MEKLGSSVNIGDRRLIDFGVHLIADWLGLGSAGQGLSKRWSQASSWSACMKKPGDDPG